jgi:arsenite methyltransferase
MSWILHKIYQFRKEICMNNMNENDIKQAVLENYAKVAIASKTTGCGCKLSSAVTAADASLAAGYTQQDVESVPEGSNMGLGCGNPQAIASLKPGETVLDLGCGGGFDCFLAAKQVGLNGFTIGVDMTSEMISKARKNVAQSSYSNIDIRLGEIENLPVADASVDVIISNCVINLSPNKPRVFAESYRVLKSGGRLAVSDVIAASAIPENVRNDLALHAGCIAGASTRQEVIAMLQKAGFIDIHVTPKEESRSFIKDWAMESGAENYVVSADIQAVKK